MELDLRADGVDPYALASVHYGQFTGHGKDRALKRLIRPISLDDIS
jgi:hypothetical protein